MAHGRSNPILSLKVLASLAALAAFVAGGLLLAFHRPASEPLVKVERASPAQMRQAMARLQDDHEALNRFLERKQSETEAKEAERARALEVARADAANEARRKAEAAAAREAAQLAAAQRKLAEVAQPKSAPRPEPRKPEEVAAEAPAGNPLPIAPPVVQPRRGPLDRAIGVANEWTDRTLAAAGAVRNFFASAADRLIGNNRSSSNLTSSW